MKVQELFEAGEVAVHDPRTPPNRDAAYIKSAYGIKVGTIARKEANSKANLYVGDWVRIADESRYDGTYGYIASKEFETRDSFNKTGDPGDLYKFKVDISKGGDKPELVEISAVKIRRNKKWSDIENFTSTSGAAGAKISAKNADVAAKSAAKTLSLEMPTKPRSSVYGDSISFPNMSFPTVGKPLHVDETKPRTATEKDEVKEFIKKYEANLQIHKEFVAENPSPKDSIRAQTLKNAEKALVTFKAVNSNLDEYISFIKMLNKEALNGDRELFDEVSEQLRQLIYSMEGNFKTIKTKATLPNYAIMARTYAAIALDSMNAEQKAVVAWAKRRDWSKEKIAAAKKTSERMKLAWKE